MEQTDKKPQSGILFLLCAAALWSTAGVLTKFNPWSGTTIACLRGILAALTQILLTRTFRFKLNRTIVLTALCYFGETFLFMIANKLTSAGSAIVLQNTSPLYIILFLYLFFRQKPSRLDCIVGVMIFGGILLSMADTLFSGDLPGSDPMLGNVLALISGVFYAGIFFCSRLPGADPLQSTILGSSMYVVLLPFVLTDSSFWANQTLPAWGSMLFMGIVQTGLAWLMFTKGIKNTPSLQASFITMIEPVLNPVLALLFLGEAMGKLSVMGSALVIVTLFLHNYLTAKQRQKAAEDAL